MNKKVLNCSYCHSDVEKKFECKVCKAVFHEECYEENGGCSILGCEASVDEEVKKNSSTDNTKDSNKKKSISNKEKVKPKDKNRKNNKVLISMLIITLIPAGYAAAYFNVMYPLLPALYTGEDVVKAFDDGILEGEETGFNEGYSSGEQAGYSQGYIEGEDDGYKDGYKKGDSAGYSRGYDSGDRVGYSRGYEDGEDSGYSSGYSAGQSAGYRSGLTDGCEWVFNTLNYSRVIGYSYSYWGGNSYGSTYLSKSSC